MDPTVCLTTTTTTTTTTTNAERSFFLYAVRNCMSSHPISMSLSMTMKVEHKEDGVHDL